MRQGFEIRESLPSGFSLLAADLTPSDGRPCFNDSTKSGECPEREGLVAYYTNRCPYSEHHVEGSLVATAERRNLALKTIKLTTREQAQAAPTPATIFSLFLDGKFVTTDIGVCMDSRFDKIIDRANAR